MLIGKEQAENFLRMYDHFVQSNQIQPSFIWNLDESSVELDHERTKVYGRVGSKQEVSPQSKHMKEHVTLGLCVCADGTHMPPFVITPTQTTTSDYRIKNELHLFHAPSGYITKDIFFTYMKNVFVPFVKERRENLNDPHDVALLLIDNHDSRFNPEMLEFLLYNRILVFCILPHSSHIFQPCDKLINKTFKHEFSAEFRRKFLYENSYTREQLLRCVLEGTVFALATYYRRFLESKSSHSKYERRESFQRQSHCP